jgi:ABC-type polysaccharide/polyol phosphate transport system ATPase subunit
VSGVAIEARRVSKQFVLRHNRSASIKSRVVGMVQPRQRERLEPFWALREISLSIRRGDQVGLIGRNGSGKSTLLKLIAGIHRPTSGQLLVARGATIGTMIELGVGFHPDLTGTENVFLNAAIHGRSREDIEAMYPKVVQYSGLERFMDVALKNYSSGMHVRLGFAIAAHLDPDVILLDEVFAVGDEEFQKKCLGTMDRFASEGRTVVFVSHSMTAVRKMCRRVCVLDAGRLQFEGDLEAGIAAYQKLLVAPVDSPDPPALPAVPSEQADEADLPTLARRHVTEWAAALLEREGVAPDAYVLEISVEAAADPLSPLRRRAAAGRYAYWQAGRPAPDWNARADVAVATTVFMHFPLQTIAQIVAVALQQLRPGGRFYATFFEAVDPFAPVSWPTGFLTSSDSAPYHFSFAMIQGLASAFGAAAERVPGVEHPNGETTVVMRAMGSSAA